MTRDEARLPLGMPALRALEATATATGGAVLGGAVLFPFGIPLLGIVVGGLNGLVSGWKKIYNWRHSRGWAAFALDSSWGLIGTTAGLCLHLAELPFAGRAYTPEMSERANWHVYAGGVRLKGGFALAIGNVISNGGGKIGLRGESEGVRRRQKLVVAHEGLHVWQHRWFGPFFPATYWAWVVVGGVWGTVQWLRFRHGWWPLVETVAYYNNPFEYWAYRNDDYWPPRGADLRVAWGARGRRAL